jgi:hypothetical protein
MFVYDLFKGAIGISDHRPIVSNYRMINVQGEHNLTDTRYVLRESHSRCRDDNPTRPKLCAVSLVMEDMAVVIRVNGYSEMDTWLGGSMRNARCTAVTDSFFANCRTHQFLCCGAAIFKTNGI